MTTSSTTRTEEDLKKLLQSYKDGLTHWRSALTSKDSSSQIKSSTVDDPIAELTKLGQLIHANTTKMGIIFAKPLKDINAAYKQTEETSSYSVLLISLSAQLADTTQTKLSKMYIDEIFKHITDLLAALDLFVTELIEDQDEKRLVGVGKIWEVVSQLINVSKLGKIGVLKLKLKDSVSMINDGVEELQEWIEDPSGSQDDDPFAFSDEEEEEEKTEDANPPSETAKEDYSDIIPVAQRYLLKIKLIKLLISSLMKNIPTTIKDSQVDQIYASVTSLNEIVDEIIYKTIFENDLAQAKLWYQKAIKASDELIAVMQKVNKNDEKKMKWITTWTSKFTE